MRMPLLTCMTLVMALSLGAPVQKSRDQAQPTHLLLATTKTSTMQKELDEAAAQGYRVLMGSPTSGSEMAVFLEKTAKRPDTYHYEVLATTRTGTMQKELNEMAEEGFRLMPSTMIAKQRPFSPVEIVVLLELPPKVEKQYEYKLLATSKTSTLQKEVLEAQEAGFVIIAMVSRGEHMVIVERETIVSN